jgi:hypothetical protein
MAKIIQFKLALDADGQPHGCIVPQSQYIDAYVLKANTPKTIAIPAGARIALFSSDNDVWINFAGVAAIPEADVTNGSASDLNPSTRNVKGYGSFSAISAEETRLVVSYYA